MSIRPTVEVLLSLVDNMSAPLRSTAQGVQGIATSLNNTIKGLASAAVAYVTADFFKSSIEEAIKAADAVSELQVSVGNAGESFTRWQPKIDTVIDSLVKMSTYTDDDLRMALSRLIDNTGKVGGSLNNMQLVADIAAKRHIDLGSAADIVSKAMNGNNKALKEFGIFVPNGTEAVGVLTKLFAGSASEAASTFGGKIKQLSNQWGEFKEDVGRAIIATDAAGNSVNQLGVTLGAVGPVIVGTVRSIANILAATVQGWQQIGATLGFIFFSGVEGMKSLVGRTIYFIGVIVAETVGRIPGIGTALASVGEKMQANGQKMVADSHQNLDNLKAGYHDSVDEIVGLNNAGEIRKTESVRKGELERGKIRNKEAEKQSAALQKAQSEYRALSNQIAKDFGAVVPAAVAKVQEQIRGVLAKVEEWRKANQKIPPDILLAVQAYQDQLEVAQKLSDVSDAIAATDTEPNRVTAMLRLNDLLKDSNRLRMDASGHVENTKLGEKLVSDINAKRVEIMKDLGDEMIANLATLTQESKDFNAHAEAETQAEKARKAARVQREVDNARYAAELVGIAAQYGIIDSRSASILNNALSLGTALATGDLVGAVGSLVGVFAGVFGSTPEEQARRAILQKNSDRLNELRQEIHALNLSTPGGKLSTLAGLNAEDVLNEGNGANRARRQNISKKDLGAYLAKNGLTVTDFKDLAAGLGLDITESNGYYTAASVEAVFSGAKTAAGKSVFGKDFSGQQDASQAYRTATGTDTAGNKVADIERNLDAADSKWLAGFFRSFDVTTPEGRLAARGAIGNLIQGLAAGTIDPALFGGLNSGEFVGALNTFIGYLGEFDTASAPQGPKTGLDVGTAGAPSVAPIVTSDFATAPASASFGFRELGDFLGGKIDTTNDKLETIIGQNDRLAAIIVSGPGSGTQYTDEALAASLALTQLSRGT